MTRSWKLLAATASLMVAAPAAASDWRYVGKNLNDSVYDIDHESIARDGNSVTFWLRVKYGAGSYQAGEANGYTARRTASCSDYSYHDLQTDYTIDGRAKDSSGEEALRYSSPDSIARAIIVAACAK